MRVLTEKAGYKDVYENIHNIKKNKGKKYVLVHNDNCDMPLIDGYCPLCKLHPDTQSKAFKEIENGY